MKRISLQQKILFGYLVLVAVIGSMVAILLHERGRTREIEAESKDIREIGKRLSKHILCI